MCRRPASARAKICDNRSCEGSPEPAKAFHRNGLTSQWSNVELLVIGSEIALQAAMAASRTIPIVLWANNYDPIARGYVKSLAQPGGNVTGIVSQQTELAEKQVELLTEALPGRTRLAMLWDSISADQFVTAERQAKSLGLDVQSLKLENPPYDFDAAFRSLAEGSNT